MAKWDIEGADKDTGEDRTITVEAGTEAAAREQATLRGILISSIREKADYVPPPPPQAIGYSAIPNDNQNSPAPTYRDITKGSRTLNMIGAVISLFGLIALAVGAVALIVSVIGMSNGTWGTAALLPFGLSAIMSGISMLIVAALIKMLAALAIAIRDIAINSFRQ